MTHSERCNLRHRRWRLASDLRARKDKPWIEAASQHETENVLLSGEVHHTEDGAYVAAFIWVPKEECENP